MALSKIFDHGGLYKKYDMEQAEIHIGTGIVKVHDIFDPLPDFMFQADCVFCDPPCSKGNLTSFYTKAEIDKQGKEFDSFKDRLFQCIDQIGPKYLILETFKSNHKDFLERVLARYPFVKVFDSMYYNSPKNHCFIIVASTQDFGNSFDPIDLMDEEKVIEWVCKHVPFSCIADPCMGKGLVGFYANQNHRKFVGTELNKKRLAVLLERVSTGDRGKVN